MTSRFPSCRSLPLIAALLGIAGSAAVAAPAGVDQSTRPDPRMLQHPDVSKDKIVFVYANDLWVVDKAGGMAMPLASPPGTELFPKFSGDGSTIAFVGNYDGNRDLYTVPLEGGLPERVTFHPGNEIICDWTPGGELLYFNRQQEGLGQMPKLFTVEPDGGLPEVLPVPYGAQGAVSPDGQWLAYTPHTRDHRTWKRYRGGMASDIWLFNLENHQSQQITDWEGTDTLPMWSGQTVYYLSDNGDGGKLNIWAYDTTNGRREQVTRFTDYDVKWPSMGPGDRGQGEIIFQNGPNLSVLDLRSQKTRVVDVTIPGARPTLRTKHVDASKFTEWWHISSTGKRAVVSARGDVWTLPAEKGSPRNLTRTAGAHERHPSWSPDGRWVAYFSDKTGEYELYVTQSDGKGETKQLTSGSQTFYYDPVWSPDSKHILFSDKAARFHLHTIESGETKTLFTDPWGEPSRPSWSHDSRWIAYSRTDDDRPSPAIWLYDRDTDEHHQVTSGFFGDTNPAFDRKGDYLYFASRRSFNPTYSDLDTTFVYRDSAVLVAVPLLAETESPWLAESDEEEWDEETDEDEESDDGDEASDEEDEEDEDAEGDDEAEDEEEAKEDDGISGTWEGSLKGGEMPPGMEFVLILSLSADGTSITGSITVPMGTGELEATYDPVTGDIEGTITTSEGDELAMKGKISGTSLTCMVSFEGQDIELSGERTSAMVDDDAVAKGSDDKAKEVVEIDIEGFERRARQLPVPAGNFGELATNDKSQLIYVRRKQSGLPEIMLFDLDDDKKEEKSIVKGAGGFEISGDGKKLIALRDSGSSIHKTSAGAAGKNVVTSGMSMYIDPREEWNQIFNEAWRLYRDFLYVDNMHGIDWNEVRDRYAAMLADCTTREDVSYVIREMISEINVGHAYYNGGDGEDQPTVNVGMLGVDWELSDGAYRIARIYEGAEWDVDARSPLREPGIDVEEGEYVLAVNGVAVNPDEAPWAAFLGTAGRAITLTVSEKPVLDAEARDVVVKPLGSERNLRYRAWIERNRAYVADKTGGNVGYIYVPDTGVRGQNDLVRQYFSQAHKDGLIIDERWNGGGQIPTRFIEMLNRPITNYWARRDNRDAKWPPDAHHGPKCMLINGLAGSGGDMFPFLFKQAELGPLIGTRTWGGLVGLSGNPGLIDGGYTSVPTFGFYEKDGTWGIEGHGVDPDMLVIDDPALMVDGGDPQLDAAIAWTLEEIDRNPYVPPMRPSPPDRSGMGIADSDK